MTDYEFRVANWDRFQHYKKRGPAWIKNYTKLLSDPAYLRLSGTQRGLLHGLWLWWARAELAERYVGLDVEMLNRVLATSARISSYKALNHAGFIDLRASTSQGDNRAPASAETEEETEKNTERSYAGTPGELERLGAVYDFQAILREQRGRGAA